MQIDRSDEHERNADSPRVAILDSGANLNCERAPHPSKHSCEIVSMEAGMQTDFIDEHIRNAAFSRIEILQPDSNVNDERPMQP
jgi:hypothetical protein